MSPVGLLITPRIFASRFASGKLIAPSHPVGTLLLIEQSAYDVPGSSSHPDWHDTTTQALASHETVSTFGGKAPPKLVQSHASVLQLLPHPPQFVTSYAKS